MSPRNWRIKRGIGSWGPSVNFSCMRAMCLPWAPNVWNMARGKGSLMSSFRSPREGSSEAEAPFPHSLELAWLPQKGPHLSPVQAFPCRPFPRRSQARC